MEYPMEYPITLTAEEAAYLHRQLDFLARNVIVPADAPAKTILAKLRSVRRESEAVEGHERPDIGDTSIGEFTIT